MVNHETWMEQAFKEAEKAFQKDEVPVGAIVVNEDRIIGRGHNLIETLQDPTAHAEMLAITSAANSLASWRLDNSTIYITLEPCVMCAGAIFLSRISNVIFGTKDPRMGACGSVINILDEKTLNAKIEIVHGVLEEKCQSILKSFFQKIRDKS